MKKLDVPTVAMEDAGYCGQACAESLMRYYGISNIPSQHDMKRMTNNDLVDAWTPMSAISLLLDDFGIQVEYFSVFGGIEGADHSRIYIKGKRTPSTQALMDRKWEETSLRRLVKDRLHSVETIAAEVEKGRPVMCLIDSGALINHEFYFGHFVIVTQIDVDEVHYIDPDLDIAQVAASAPIAQFTNAYYDPLNARDTIVTSGIKQL